LLENVHFEVDDTIAIQDLAKKVKHMIKAGRQNPLQDYSHRKSIIAFKISKVLVHSELGPNSEVELLQKKPFTTLDLKNKKFFLHNFYIVDF
jgi:hypothetical protein